MSELKNAHRIYNNILILLGRGMFAGEGAEALHEAQKFVAEMIANVEKEIAKDEQAAATEDRSGSGTEAGTGRVESGEVPAPRRSRGKRKGN